MSKKQRKKHVSNNQELTFKKKEHNESKEFLEKIESFTNQKHVKYIWIALLIIIIMIISSYVRLGTLHLPITDVWAENMVEGNLKANIEQQIRSERPDLPDSSIRRLVEQEYASVYKENKDFIEAQKKSFSQNYKSLLQNDKGMTYLLGIDEYIFYSYAKWYDRKGFFGTEIVDGEPRFMLRQGRFGEPASFRMHPFLIKVVHDAWKPFNSNFNIEWASFYIQVIMVALSAVPLFFLTKRISGTTGAFISTVLVLTAVPLVGRTLGGSSDDDVYTFLFTFIMMALFVYSLDKKAVHVAILAGIAGLFNALFMLTWSGWWYGFLLVLGSAGLYLIYEFARKKIQGTKLSVNDWMSKSAFVVVFFVSSVLFAMLISPLSNNSATDMAYSVISSPANPLDLIMRLGAGAELRTGAGQYPLWPNVLRTVAELNRPSVNQIINGPGRLPLGGDAGILFFWIGIIGSVGLFFRYKENPNYPFMGMVLLVWILGMFIVAQSAVRFILMVSIPVLIGVGAFIGLITGPLAKYVSKSTKLKKSWFIAGASVLLALWFLWAPVSNARAISENAVPLFDDAWYDSVYAMKDHAGDTRGVVSSWWDYGHFFQAYGEQTVTFDGGDQGKRIYWMGRTLLTHDVTEAHNILKVMNCGQEKPYDLLESHMGERFRPTMIKLAITQMNRDDARILLEEEGLPEHVIQEVLDLSHCSDLMPMYFVTSGDMVGKAPVWSHFGGWNFTRAYFYYRLRHLSFEEAASLANEHLDFSREKTMDLYARANSIRNEDEASSWISPFVSYYTRNKVSCRETNETVVCDFDLVLQQDASSNTALVLKRGVIPLDNSDEAFLLAQVVRMSTGSIIEPRTFKPQELVMEKNGDFQTVTFDNPGLPISLVLMNEASGFKALLTDPSLSKSVFTRLFFMEGRGDDLNMFEKISDETSFRGERIIIWEVHP